VQRNDGLLLFFGDVSMLDVGPQIVHPTETATFASSCQTWEFTHVIQDQGQSNIRRQKSERPDINEEKQTRI